MSDRIVVGTRKGLFELHHLGDRWDIAATAFLGDPVSMVLPVPAEKSLFAALALGHFGVKMHRSDDDGAAWQEIVAPAFPKADGENAPSVSLIWALEDGGGGANRLWAGTVPGRPVHLDRPGRHLVPRQTLVDHARAG